MLSCWCFFRLKLIFPFVSSTAMSSTSSSVLGAVAVGAAAGALAGVSAMAWDMLRHEQFVAVAYNI